MTLVTNLDLLNVAWPAGPARALASFQRPADTVAYASGDVISDSTSTAKAIVFRNVGRTGKIFTAHLVTSGGAMTVAAADYELHLFTAEPTNHLDNAALAVAAADLPNFVGSLRLLDANKIVLGTNINYYRATGPLGELFSGPLTYANGGPGITGAGNIFGLLGIRSGSTPASAMKFTIALDIDRT